jgi:hypothetical protein
MAKRAVSTARRADDKRITGTVKNPSKLPNVKPITARASRVESFRYGVAGGGAGRPRTVK